MLNLQCLQTSPLPKDNHRCCLHSTQATSHPPILGGLNSPCPMKGKTKMIYSYIAIQSPNESVFVHTSFSRYWSSSVLSGVHYDSSKN